MIAKLSMICTKQIGGAYFAICPEVKGCFTQGDTYEEAAASLKELVDITLKEELLTKDIQEILLSKEKIFSEFEVVI